MDDPSRSARTRLGRVLALVALAMTSVLAWSPGPAAGFVPSPTSQVSADPVADDPGGQVLGWDAAFFGPGLNGTVTAATVWDDGTGPALYVGGLFRTAGSQVVNQIARWDGSTWSPLAGPDGIGVSGSVYSLAVYDGDLIVGGAFNRAGGVRVNQIARWDGSTWSALEGPAGVGVSHEREPAVLAMTVHDGALVVGGSFGFAGGVPVNHVARWDGTGWSPLQGETRPGVRHQNVPSAAAVTALAVYDGDLMVGGRFTEAGEIPVNGIARWDGLQWTVPAGAGTGLTGFGIPSVMSFAVVGDDLVAGGFFSGIGTVTAGNIVRWDGTTWSALGGGLDNAANTLTVADGELYAGGTFTTSGGTRLDRVARWDGTDWQPLTASGGTGVAAQFSAAVNALVSYDGRLVVAGGFDTAGGTVANNLASWDGTAWSALAGLGSTGLSGGGPVIYDLVEYDGDVVAAGSFGAAGDAAASMIARWDGTGWAPLGGGIGGFAVNDLIVHDGVLVAAGNFNRAGDADVRNLAAWDGSTWSPFGGGTDREVRALAELDGDLVAGGSFTEAGGVAAQYIASWDGQTWTALGDGLDDRVRALTVHDGHLVAGGAFSQAGKVAANGVARWDGAAWSPLGAGTSGQVDALAVYDGDVVAAGSFLEAGGRSADRIARWDGEDWWPLDLGLNNVATELTEFQGDLVAAGSFVEAGRVRADRIARWDGTSWSALAGPGGNGIDGTVSALLARGDELLAGGSFTTSGGLPAWNLASYGPLDLVATPAELEFGTVTIGTTTPPSGLTLSNAGDDDITVTSVTPPGAPFAAAGGTCGTAPFTLSPGAGCTLEYTFSPAAGGRATGTVTVSSDARASWLPLTLTGTGTAPAPAADVTPDALSAEVRAGETGGGTVVIGNTGEAPLTWRVLGADGAPAAGAGAVLHPSGPATVPATAGSGDPSGFGTGAEAGAGDSGAGATPEPFAAPEDQVTLTHSASTEIVRDHSLACNGPLGTTDETAYLRTFTLADFGIDDAFDVSEVTFGVQRLNTTATITVNLYTLDGELTYANLNPIGSATQELRFQASTMVSVPVTGSAPAGSTLVVEIVAPSLSGTGAFYPGSNAAGETAPTYAAAHGCDTPEPTPVAELGAPDMHLVLAVTGGERPVCTLPAWLTAGPATGTTAPGATSEVSVGYDAAGLTAGEHAANLCVETDDPMRPLAVVPVTLTVTETPVFALTAEAERVRPYYYRVHLAWTGAPGEAVDVYRDGELLATTANDGAHTDELGRVREATTFEYRLCVAGTETCAEPVEIEIDPRPGRFAVSTVALPPLNVLESYATTLSASGGEPPYTWAATGLPPGLTLTPSSGLISTDPAAPAVTDASSVTVGITVTDARGATATADLPLTVHGVEAVAMGEQHTCAVAGATAYCWGDNLSGQLGTGTSGTEPMPLPVRVVADVTDVAAGAAHTCALHSDTTVSCWGFNGAGRLGTGDEESSAVPRTVVASEAGGAPLTGVVDIVAGSTHTCALLADGTARCWGYNNWGALGNGSIAWSTVPAVVADPADTSRPFAGLTQLSAGSHHTCAVTEAGTAYCWGWNVAGQLGIGRAHPGPTTLPSPVVAGPSGEPLTGVRELGAGNVHSCAVLADSTARCWGQNAYGQLGSGTAPANSPVPVAVLDAATGEPVTGVARLRDGGLHSCAVTTDGGALCWGLNESGQLGDGVTTDRDVAAPVLTAGGEPFGGVAEVASRQYQSCAVTVTGALSCWGANGSGQLGDGGVENRSSPAPVRPGAVVRDAG